MSQGEPERRHQPPMESSSDGPGEDHRESPSVNAEALRNIVNDTLRNQDQDWPAADLETLRDVARKHRGRPFELRPVAVDLVDSILRLRIGQGDASQLPPREMVEQIATTLAESPGTFDRLEEFWELLCESTP